MLRELAFRAWGLYKRAEHNGFRQLVHPSIPILYFGDSLSYLTSPIKVVTVGLNPSLKEFPCDSPFSRFPGAAHVSEAVDLDADIYLASLNSYFRVSPYKGWFQSFDPILQGLSASYYPGDRSRALHTDLCSPLATDPTWSRLNRSEQAILEPEGRQLWRDLVEALQPDVVLVSVRQGYLAKIDFPQTQEPGVVYTVDDKNRRSPYQVKAFRRRLLSGKEPLFVFGRAAQTPFGAVSGADKRLIGETLLALI
ncbi:MAG: hypothetical protein HY683_09910 [Chloroflexi bacterium]|nr:hypothetical protein [Chloroflexota bacterium]